MARARPEDGSAEAELMVHMGEGRLLEQWGCLGEKRLGGCVDTRFYRRQTAPQARFSCRCLASVTIVTDCVARAP